MIHGLPQVVHQGHLERAVHSLFKGENIQVNVRKDAKIKNTTGSLLELDLWLPNLQLCFEFQDPYHYVTSWDSNIPLGLVKKKDALKREEMQRRGETIIVVPFWWDATDKSLAATIKFHRPDLLREVHGGPITTLNPDIHFFKDWIPDVGELMLASFPMALNIDMQKFWWLGEKYDGLRVVWNSKQRSLYSRYAYEISFPYSCQFPKSEFLDGEIWFGRGAFAEVQKYVNNEDFEWELLRFIAFDEASPVARNIPFEARYAKIVNSVDPDNPLVILAMRVACNSEELVSFFTNTAISDHGEGVIMRKPHSIYISGRSRFLYKLKASRGDAEGLVTEVAQGWIQVQLPNGRTIRFPNQENSSLQLKRGDIVSFIYDNFSARSVPVNPKIERVRADLTWENVVREFQKAKSEALKLNDHSSRLFGKRRQIPAHQEEQKKKAVKLFFEKYARSKNFDPLDPESWYYSNQSEMRKLEGANRILKHYKGSLMKALIDVYPSVKFEKTKFKTIPRHHWASETNRRNYLIKYAASKGFDALVAKNWYKAKIAGFIKTKGLAALVWHYGGSFTKALLHLFPEVGIDKSKLKFSRKSLGKLDLRTQEARRNFFTKFAARRRFDPLEATAWYSVSPKQLKKERGYNTVLTHHCGSLARALLAAFPNIGLESKKFGFLAKNLTKDPKERREFFVKFAASRGFDPLVAKNWYPILKRDLLNTKGAHGVLNYHNDNIKKALCELFPEIGLESNMFSIVQRNYWGDSENRKNYFIQFARDNMFDPLIAENWYKFKNADIPKHHVLHYHKNQLANALADLFPDIGLRSENFVAPTKLQ
eukprot:Phypoly_transcript_00805.p1 GENE.Phypoly_transcript_00805~~Phypoly_transcript_00805.p1  ORF type:complete len:823 (+),score=101.61 Phypoly_transcript_00805:1404-3872(+)